ncbi:hypothetical protein BDL97_11G004900 [Sphagnum fallax]|nr:hypothetical protein BDL97_11G004900 [Sphagnum fallax]
MGSLGAAIAGPVESLCLPRRRLMNSKSPPPLGGTHEDNCSSIQQPHFQCVLKVRMAASLMALCIAVLQLSSMESRPPDADNLSRGNIGAVEELYYRNTLMLLDAMKAHKVKILIYSSTCATSGEPKRDANHRRYTADPKGRL